MWLIPRQLQLKSDTSRSSQESECSTSDSDSPASSSGSGPAFWVTSSGKPTLRPASWRGWRTRPWSRRLFGAAISETSRGSRFVAEWIASQADSLVRTSALPAEGMESKASEAACGSTCSTPLAIWDAQCSHWKTSQQSLFEDSTPFADRWPNAGLMRSGCVYRRPPLAFRTSETDGSVWPTATAMDSAGSENQGHGNPGTTLTTATRQWATAQNVKSGSTPAPNQRQIDLSLLQDQTPTGQQSSSNGRTSRPRLNPAFVCWLMSWPWWWTRAERISFARQEMESYRRRQLRLLSSFFGDAD